MLYYDYIIAVFNKHSSLPRDIPLYWLSLKIFKYIVIQFHHNKVSVLVHWQMMMMAWLLQMTKVEFMNSLRHMCLNM